MIPVGDSSSPRIPVSSQSASADIQPRSSLALASASMPPGHAPGYAQPHSSRPDALASYLPFPPLLVFEGPTIPPTAPHSEHMPRAAFAEGASSDTKGSAKTTAGGEVVDMGGVYEVRSWNDISRVDYSPDLRHTDFIYATQLSPSPMSFMSSPHIAGSSMSSPHLASDVSTSASRDSTPFFDYTAPVSTLGGLGDTAILSPLVSPRQHHTRDFDIATYLSEDLWAADAGNPCNNRHNYGHHGRDVSPSLSSSSGSSTVGLSPFAHRAAPHMMANSTGLPTSRPASRCVPSRPMSTLPVVRDGISDSFHFHGRRAATDSPPVSHYHMPAVQDHDAAYEQRMYPAQVQMGYSARPESARSHTAPYPIRSARPDAAASSRYTKSPRDGPTRAVVATPAVAMASASRRKRKAVFICDMCGRDFTKKINLEGHIRSHRGDKPFKCGWHPCEKGFARESDLKRHMKIHERVIQDALNSSSPESDS